MSTMDEANESDTADDDPKTNRRSHPDDLTMDEEFTFAAKDTSSLDVNHLTAPNGETKTGSTKDKVELDDVEEVAKNFFASETNSIGRYRIEHRLGYGGFGSVFLATDTDLHRRVAIKIPHSHRMSHPKDIERFLSEARTVAALDHPGIVPIYDFGRMNDRCYVVSKFIEGGTVGQRISEITITLHEAVKIIRSVAETLAFVHKSRVVHRDIKPGNLLLDAAGICYLTDFGLALHDTSAIRKQGRIGTHCYMSPEQARGESHLVDGRSDLFSLGIVMYELICGSLPFVGDELPEILDRICKREPKRPRARNAKIPKELERVCLKLLSKRAASRYQSSEELIDDLDYFVEGTVDRDLPSPTSRSISTKISTQSTAEPVGMVPRGLRSFDEEDASYFRMLLPGPVDRYGLPDSLQFWRRRIENSDPNETFRVGVLYGSSGSGKSSFIKAGLIPILESNVTVLFIEASQTRTEYRLRNAVTGIIDAPPSDASLPDLMARVRREHEESGNAKVLIVIDQFEQWLHGWGNDPETDLSSALRQCDGSNLQCLLLVRDDYWIGVSQFVEELDVELARNQNLAMVDLFDRRHAKKVLTEYGRGYQRLPDDYSELSPAQNEFLNAAVDGLCVDGKIIPVQLVTFAEIMKSRDWSPSSLQEVGGTKGVGLRFLDEFLGAGAPVDNRVHLLAVQKVLDALLPESGSQIKGAMRSEQELRRIAGYQDQPKKFDRMMQMLDNELRLITPADSNTESGTDEPTVRFYQLTHDFLVPAIRNWLQRDLRLTIKGRTSMRLSDRANVWDARRERRHLPSWFEWLGYLIMAPQSQYSDSERRMMQAATFNHGITSALGIAALGLTGWLGYSTLNTSHANSLVRQLRTANFQQAETILDDVDEHRRWCRQPLEEWNLSIAPDDPNPLPAKLALLRLNPDRTDLIDEVTELMLSGQVNHVPLIARELQRCGHVTKLTGELWDLVGAEDADASASRRINAALALARLDPSSQRWQELADPLVTDLLGQVSRQPQDYGTMVSELLPIAPLLFDPLHQVFVSESESNLQVPAENLILGLYGDDSSRLTIAYLDSNPDQFDRFIAKIDESSSDAMNLIDESIQRHANPSMLPSERHKVSTRQVNAAALKLTRGDALPIWDLLRSSKIPNTRSGLIEQLIRVDTDPDLVLGEYHRTDDASVQSAMLMILGGLDQEQWNAEQRSTIVQMAKDAFLKSPDAELHSVAHWLLLRLGPENKRWLGEEIDLLSNQDMPQDFNWTVDSFGQTFIRFRKPKYTLEVATHEVTMEQYQRMPGGRSFPQGMKRQREHPVALTNWYQAVAYCRWLTNQGDMLDEDQCHPGSDEEQAKYHLYPDYLKRRGYRLLRPEEWTEVCLGNAVTKFAMGYDFRLFDAYARTPKRGSVTLGLEDWEDTHPVMTMKPLPTGLFGMYGNVTEWCAERYPRTNDTRPIRGPDNDVETAWGAKRICEHGFQAPKTYYYSIGFRICRVIPNDE